MSIAPLETYRTAVPAEWIDYNGHMNLAYYVLAFDRGTDGLLDRLGLGAAYRRASNHSIYVLEAHVTYDREVKAGDPIAVATRLVAADDKRLHIFHEMRHETAGYRAATTELMALHVDLAGPRATPLPGAARPLIQELVAADGRLPPAPLGRRIAMSRRTA